MTIADDIKNQFPILKVDIEDRVPTRIVSQYQESEKFLGEVKSYAVELNKLRDALGEMLIYRCLELAEGENLDAIGGLVGAERQAVTGFNTKFFGFQDRPILDPPRNLGFGDRDEVGSGGRFKLRTDPDDYSIFTDVEYKPLILTKIVSNNRPCVSDAITEMVLALINVLSFARSYQAQLYIYLLSVDIDERSLLLLSYKWIDRLGHERSFLPLTLGVDIKFRSSKDSECFFGYVKDPMACGYMVGSYAYNPIR